MSTLYYTYVIFGLKIKYKDFVKTRWVKCFNHNEIFNEDKLFCPKTGRQLWKQLEFFPDDSSPYDFDEIFGFDYIIIDDYVYVGQITNMLRNESNLKNKIPTVGGVSMDINELLNKFRGMKYEIGWWVTTKIFY